MDHRDPDPPIDQPVPVAPELPPPPEQAKRHIWEKPLAIIGIALGFFPYIIPGFFALRSYTRWREGKIGKPLFAWIWGGIMAVLLVLVGIAALSALLDETSELITVDFVDGVDPFDLGEDASAKYEHVEGTYRLTVSNTSGPVTSLGEFGRTAGAVGITVELMEITEPDTMVGAMCLGPQGEGVEGLAGYGFFVEAGGGFVLGRQDPGTADGGGRIEFLEKGTDGRIQTVERVSVKCVPDADGDVSLTGYANSLQVITAVDPDGYDMYTYAGLTVLADEPGTEVRFKRVVARVPDDEWTP